MAGLSAGLAIPSSLLLLAYVIHSHNQSMHQRIVMLERIERDFEGHHYSSKSNKDTEDKH
jgi:hypothetical protein